MPRRNTIYTNLTTSIVFAMLGSSLRADQGLPRETHSPTLRLDYNRDVRPILAAKCFHCHGADPKAIQAGEPAD